MRLAVDSACQAADDDQPGRRELTPEHPRDLRAVGGAGSRAHDCHRRTRQKLRVARATQEQGTRRIVDLAQQLRQLATAEATHRRSRSSRHAHAAAASWFGVR